MARKKKSRSKNFRGRRYTTPVPARRSLTPFSLSSLPTRSLPVSLPRSFMLHAPLVRQVKTTGYQSAIPQVARQVRDAYICAKRKIRREVIFAVAPGGRGGSPRRKKYSNKPPSNVRC